MPLQRLSANGFDNINIVLITYTPDAQLLHVIIIYTRGDCKVQCLHARGVTLLGVI